MAGWKKSVFAMEIRKVFAYRLDFWVNFLGQTLFSIFIAYFLWLSVFQTTGKESIKGFTLDKMIIYYLLAPLILRIQQGLSIGAISQDIYDGALSKYLLYPINFFGFKVLTHLARSSVYLVQLFLICGLFAIFFNKTNVLDFGAVQAAQFVIAMFFISISFFFLNALAELVAFWADYIWSLGVILRFMVGFFGGSLIPLVFFPEWASSALAYTPFPYMISFPISILLGGVSWEVFLANLSIIGGWTLLFIFFSSRIWKVGRLRYTGVGI